MVTISSKKQNAGKERNVRVFEGRAKQILIFNIVSYGELFFLFVFLFFFVVVLVAQLHTCA